MNGVVYKKYLELKNIIKTYNDYKNGCIDIFDINIKKVKTKLTEKELKILRQAYEESINNVLTILANTKRVFVKLEKNNIADINFENLFTDID